MVNVPGGDLVAEFEYLVPQAVAYCPDNVHIEVGGKGRNVEIWNVDTLQKTQNVDIGRPIDCVAVSSGGNWIAAGCADGTLKAWQFPLS